MIGADLLRFSDVEVVLWDFESQRVNLLGDNLPFQCSFIVANRHRVLSTHDYYLNWGSGFKMSPGAAQITRFNPEWVRNGDDPEFVLDAFESHMLQPNRLLVGHSVLGFDTGLWNLWREKLGRPRQWDFLSRVIDTHLLSRAWKEGWKPDRSSPEAFLAWQYKVAAAYRKGIKTNLTQMCKDLEIPIDETQTHNGLYDLQLNIQLYWKLINLMEI